MTANELSKSEAAEEIKKLIQSQYGINLEQMGHSEIRELMRLVNHYYRLMEKP